METMQQFLSYLSNNTLENIIDALVEEYEDFFPHGDSPEQKLAWKIRDMIDSRKATPRLCNPDHPDHWFTHCAECGRCMHENDILAHPVCDEC